MRDNTTSPPEPRLDVEALLALPGAIRTTRTWTDGRGVHVEVTTTFDDADFFAGTMFLAEALIEEPAPLAQWQALISSDAVLTRAAQWMDAQRWLVPEDGVPDFTTTPPTPRVLMTLHPSVELALRGIDLPGGSLTQRLLGAWRRTTRKRGKHQP